MNALTLADLATIPVWVAWQTEDRKEGRTKVPYAARGNGKARADAPQTWGTRPQAEARAATLPKPHGSGGIGLELGDLSGGRCVAGVDLDTCRAADGALTPWAVEVIERLKSYTEVSPSGGGAKAFFLMAPADLLTVRAELGTNTKGEPLTGRKWAQPGKGEHPPSIELYLCNRYFAVTDLHLAGTPPELREVSLDTMLWLIREAGPAFVEAAKLNGKKSAHADSSRSAIAFRKGAMLRRAGKSYDEMCAVLRTDPDTAAWVAEKGEPDNQRQLRRIWENAASDWIGPTEDAVAQAFAAKYVGSYVHDHTSGLWHIWRDGRWARDTRNSVFNAARDFTRAARAPLSDPPVAMAKIGFCSAVERASRADPRCAVSQEIWDRDPWMLGVPGGIVDLRTGEMREADPDFYMSRQASIAPAAVGTATPLWSAFLDGATNRDKDLQGFLQRLAGYLLTGVVNEEVLTFLYGPGGNGKGVFLGAIVGIMAEYAVAVPIEVFTAGSRLNLEYYRAQMAGARLVTASETEAQATWAESQIKEMTGNEVPLSGRHPYGQPFTFWPQFKIVLVGNHAPKLKGRSPAMERRLRVAPFSHRPPNPDLRLKEKLRAEWPGILRWMIAGCLAWQRQRLGTAAAVTAATVAYFEQQDGFRRWIDERCILGPDSRTKPGALLADFIAWARETGEESMGNNAFAELIDRTPGLTRAKTHGVRWVKGIGFKPPLKRPAYQTEDGPNREDGEYGDTE